MRDLFLVWSIVIVFRLVLVSIFKTLCKPYFLEFFGGGDNRGHIYTVPKSVQAVANTLTVESPTIIQTASVLKAIQ